MTNVNNYNLSLIFPSSLNKPGSEQSSAVKRLAADNHFNNINNENAGQAGVKIQISELAQNKLNIHDSTLSIQTTADLLNNIDNHMLQIRNLVVQSYNFALSQPELEGMQQEIDAHKQEINRILDTATVNGQPVFKTGQLTLQTRYKDGETVTISLQAMNMRTLGLEGLSIADPRSESERIAGTYNPLQHLDPAMQKVDDLCSELDDVINTLNNENVDPAIVKLARDKLNIHNSILAAQATAGVLNNIDNHMLRIRDLVVHSYDLALSQPELEGMQQEIDARKQEINRVLDMTTVNGQPIFKTGQLTLQTGYKDGETVTISLQAMNMRTLGLEGLSIADPRSESERIAGAYNPLQQLDPAIQKVDNLCSELDDVINTFSSVG